MSIKTAEEVRAFIGTMAQKHRLSYDEMTPLWDLFKAGHYSGERTCDCCQFWRKPPKSRGLEKIIPEHRYCMHSKNGSIRDAESTPDLDEAAFFETHSGSPLSGCPDYEFVTGPKFGCLHFVAK